jgi:hypothetical protein
LCRVSLTLRCQAFHPSTFKNREKVWMKEQEKKREEEAVKELKAQLEEERQRDEMQRMYTGSVHGKTAGAKQATGIEWMYSAPLPASSKDDYLVGKKFEEDKPDLKEELGKTGLERAVAAGRSAADEWSRTQNDPLLAIKMQEKNALEAIKNNPVKMARLKAALGMAGDKDEDEKKRKKKKEKKREKKERKEKKAKKERKRSRSRSRSKESSKRRRSRSRSRSWSRSRSRSREKRRHRRSLSPPVVVAKKEPLVVPAGYGLQFPGGRPPSPARERPDEAAPAKPSDKAKARPRHVAGKLTEEERAARLEAMLVDAVAVERDRGKRVLTAEEEERKEEAERAAISAEPATFIRDLNRKVFTEEESRLGDRMAATRHTRSRNVD